MHPPTKITISASMKGSVSPLELFSNVTFATVKPLRVTVSRHDEHSREHGRIVLRACNCVFTTMSNHEQAEQAAQQEGCLKQGHTHECSTLSCM